MKVIKTLSFGVIALALLFSFSVYAGPKVSKALKVTKKQVATTSLAQSSGIHVVPKAKKTRTIIVGPNVEAILIDRSGPNSVRDGDDDGEGDGGGEEQACEDNPETDCDECCQVLYNPGSGPMLCCDSNACGYAGDDSCPSGGTPPTGMDQTL